MNMTLFMLEDIFTVIPMHYFFLILLFLLAGILYLLKKRVFTKYEQIKPTDMRKTLGMDGHVCWSGLEAEVDNYLHVRRIPHDKPQQAKNGEFFTNSTGVPNFVVFKDWNKSQIHSIIELRGLDTSKKIPKVIHTPQVKPQYPYLNLSIKKLLNIRWKSDADIYFKDLIKEIKQWAEQEKIDLINFKDDFAKKNKK